MWTLEIRLFCHRPIVVSTVSRIHCYFFFVFLILVRVWSDINCHENRELLGRLKQSITGPIYWRQKKRPKKITTLTFNECATCPNFLHTRLAGRAFFAPASCARFLTMFKLISFLKKRLLYNLCKYVCIYKLIVKY